MPELDYRWEMNRFLSKWLKFCTHQGHIFLACTTTAIEPLESRPRIAMTRRPSLD